jgi:hypothetical protein
LCDLIGRSLDICESDFFERRLEECKEDRRDIGARLAWVSCDRHELLIEVTGNTIPREDACIILDEMICLEIPSTTIDREVSDTSLIDILTRDHEWREIWIWKVSIVHRIFLGSQWSRESFFIIPASCLLIWRLPCLIEIDLTDELDIDRTTDRGE